MSNAPIYIGIMSGTSLDGVDIIAAQFDPFKLIACDSVAFPENLRSELLALTQPAENEIDRLGSIDHQLGKFYADIACAFIQKNQLNKTDIAAVGCHGQTVRHRPDFTHPFTLQIGDPNIIAYQTGITTVADFRRRDMAAAGQGAPLVPAFHKALFASPDHDRLIINIGGIANITALPRQGKTIGFDTGPGNGLMDAWIQKNKKLPFDKNGAWAAGGKIIDALLAELMNEVYLKQNPPKSTGRELFHLNWLEEKLKNFKDANTQDVQATLCEFTALSIADAINRFCSTFNQVFICGGGAYNTFLMQRLETLLHPRLLASTASLGLDPRWVESSAFAWLSKQTLEKKPGNLPSVTGASSDVILGAIYFA